MYTHMSLFLLCEMGSRPVMTSDGTRAADCGFSPAQPLIHSWKLIFERHIYRLPMPKITVDAGEGGEEEDGPAISLKLHLLYTKARAPLYPSVPLKARQSAAARCPPSELFSFWGTVR